MYRDLLRRGALPARLQFQRTRPDPAGIRRGVVPGVLDLRRIEARAGVPRIPDAVGSAFRGSVRNVRKRRLFEGMELALQDGAPDGLLRRASGSGNLPRVQ